MTQGPQSDQPRNRLPKETRSSRWFPLLAPVAVVAVALIIMLVMWLPQ
jgi:hypothetical protein